VPLSGSAGDDAAVSERVSRLLAGVVAAATVYAGPWRRAHLRLLISERLHQRHRVETRYGSLVFVSTHARALEAPREFFSREPETLAWIDGFAPGAVFWDIGANVGVYSLYAGLRGDIEVLAFEPSAPSYAALCANLAANRLNRVRAYCIALADETRLGTLNMSQSYPGSVYNAFEQEVDMTGAALAIERRQPALGISPDDLIERLAGPPQIISSSMSTAPRPRSCVAPRACCVRRRCYRCWWRLRPVRPRKTARLTRSSLKPGFAPTAAAGAAM
jgi:FkbM family methyltransferase